LVTGLAAAIPGCDGESSPGDTSKAGEANSAGKDAGAGESNGGSGNVGKPMGGEGGVESQAGNGGTPLVEGGTSSTMAGAGAGGVEAGAGAGGGEVGGAGGEASCIIGAQYGNLGPIDGFTQVDGLDSAIWAGDLQVVSPYRGLLSIELYDGYTPFEAGIEPVTNHVLAGDDLNFATCGLCVRLVELDENEDATKYYMATAGTVTVTSVSGRITGSATGLTFQEVTIEEDTGISSPVLGGCKSSVTGVQFDESTAVGGAGGAGN